MTSTLEAPARMGRRAQATEMLSRLPADLRGTVVQLVFEVDAYPSTSFIDEVIRVVLVDRGADRLVFTNPNARVVEVAELSASGLGVRHKLALR